MFFARHFFGIWVSSCLKLCSWFFDEQRQLFMRLHPSRNKRQLAYLPYPKLRLHPVVNERQLTYFPWLENSPCVDFFGGLFLSTKYGREFASPLTYTWLIESEALPCLSPLVIIERVGERDSLSPCYYPVILAYYYRPLTVKCIRVSYFLVTLTRILWWKTRY